MINNLLSLLAPHHCSGCAITGTLLCDNCKYDIVSEDFSSCAACGTLTDGCGICRMCQMPYSRAWCVGERSGPLQRLIGNFKFQNAKSGYKALGELLLDRVPQLPPETVIVPIPTVSSHIRQRGYDHTLLIAKHFAHMRKHAVSQVIQRATSTKQRQASKAQRIAQAKVAFKIAGTVNPDIPYLLIDDVMTTGATIQSAAQLLKDSGARDIWVAIIARQPLD